MRWRPPNSGQYLGSNAWNRQGGLGRRRVVPPTGVRREALGPVGTCAEFGPPLPNLCQITWLPANNREHVRFPNLTPRIPGNGSRSGKALKKSGEGGIRTHGTLLRYNALAKRGLTYESVIDLA